MNGYDKLISRATRQLDVDPELQMDVAAELLAHLEDSTEEFMRGGMDADEASASAVKALGDPDELAGQLFAANRRRMKLRGIFRWSARVALVPAAIAVVVFLVVNLVGTTDWLLISDPEMLCGMNVGNLVSDDMSADDKFVLLGDPAAGTPLEGAKSISDRWPDNPVYYGNYAIYALSAAFSRERGYSAGPAPDPTVVLDRGMRLDTDNSFYDYYKGALLILDSSKYEENPELTYVMQSKDGERKADTYLTNVTDEEKFHSGLDAIRRGISKPEFAIRTLDMAEVRLALLPKPQRFRDVMGQMALQVSTILPPLSQFRNGAMAICGRAVALAKQGDRDGAIELLNIADAMALRMGAQCRFIITLLNSLAIRNMVLGHAQCVYATLGLEAEADEAAARRKKMQEKYLALWSQRTRHEAENKTLLTRGGVFWSVMLAGFIDSDKFDFEPMRTAEHAVARELALVVLLSVLVCILLILGLFVMADIVFRRNRPEGRGLLLFVGWGRLGAICLWAVVVPLGVYWLYARVITSGDEYGLNYAASRAIIEYALTGAAVIVLLVVMAYSNIRKRAAEIGIDVKPPARPWRKWLRIAVAALAAGGCMVYLVGWWMGYFRPTTRDSAYRNETGGSMIGAGVLLILGVWLVLEFAGMYCRKGFARFRRTVFRSMVPIIASAVIVVGVICGWALSRAETSAVRRIKGDAYYNTLNEIDFSNFREFKKDMACEYRQRFAAGHKSAPTGE